MADIQEQYNLANDSFFRTVLDTGAVLRLGTVSALNVDGSLAVDIADEDGSLIDVWPLDGKLFAEGAIVYVLLFHSRGVGLALGVAKGPFPVLDLSQMPDTWVAAPTSASAAGVAGSAAYDSSFYYVCVATGTWKRAGLSTW